MKRRLLALLLICIAIFLLILVPILAFTPLGTALQGGAQSTTSPTAIPRPRSSPTPIPTAQPVLTARGTAPATDATAELLLDADTGNVLYEKNGEMPLMMASTTKIMTALIAIQTADLERPIHVHQDAIDRVILDDGSSAGLQVGDVVPLKEMLYALMLPSGNDAAYAIADELGGGDRAVFINHMNLFAQRLYLYQTHYSSPDGLTGDSTTHYTTAYDLARLSRYAMSIPLFAAIVHTQTYTAHVGGRTLVWTNTNKLLGNYAGATGIKTGHTFAAGYCLVFAATSHQHHLIGVLLNSPEETQRNIDAAALLDWGFHLPMLPPRE
ncbi:D-alanyl-D-alanine carboxypeptidase family protein [Dictyobacter aurantiacus]|uniref:D-alanyl-D-alanine carboxypeptidase n=1 Tax=Dictyobacter aurantiacus TaxID=1936993 RepID=A0A401Z9Y9_9CHLR|nr:D-alanyl-D-alanine carboxypeptidase family protein [Dictyobacter aurantiacus]GCE03633.1 D-alanyl-D-alanine carboxypeptidase [Dictyobacter aurantiacus]